MELNENLNAAVSSKNNTDTGNSSPSTRAAQIAGHAESFDLQTLIHHLIARIVPILAASVLGALLACVLAVNSTNAATYAATAKLYTIGSSSITNVQMSSILTADYLELFNTWEIHSMVREKTGVEYSDARLKSSLSVVAPEGTHLIYITVVTPDPQTSIDLANAYGNAVQALSVQKMHTEMPSFYSKAVSASIIGGGVGIVSMAICGLLLGFIFACGIVALIVFLDDKPYVPEDISLRTIAVLAKNGGKTKTLQHKQFRNGNGMNILAFPMLEDGFIAGIEQLCAAVLDDQQRVYMITSRYSGEGKTLVAMSMLRQLAEMKKKVVLVDADFRSSGLQSQYKLLTEDGQMLGLGDLLSDRCSIDQIIYQTNLSNASIVPIGSGNSRHMAMLSDRRMTCLIDALRSRFDLVLIDTSAAGMYPDATLLAGYCDEAILITDYARGLRGDVPKVAQIIRDGGCEKVSAVLNRIPFRSYLARNHYYRSERYVRYRSRNSGRRDHSSKKR